MPKRDRSRSKLILPNWVRSRMTKAPAAPPPATVKHPQHPLRSMRPRKTSRQPSELRPMSRQRANVNLNTVFKGIVDVPTSRRLEQVAASLQRRHRSAATTFRLPVYRDPQARRRARERRVLANARGILAGIEQTLTTGELDARVGTREP